ncbi:hypothetical protein N8796_00925 [Candidatus Pelagibacter sp.]|nr:hypothetical protein [Candidatus Pelagibacter sp.]
MLKVLLVGAGQIGSRYLQGLICSTLNISITVVDPLDISLNVSKKRWIEAGGDQSLHTISWNKELPSNKERFDLIIVTTSSKGRATLIKKIASNVSGDYWVIEKVLAQSKKELDIIQVATTHAKEVWVNMPRRVMSWHQKLRLKFYQKGPLKVKNTGGLWGLACNSIHFIDLISWWTGESLLSLNTSKLNNTWLKSKRLGYYEVSGELLATFSNGTQLILESQLDAKEDIMKIEIKNENTWVIDEINGVAHDSKKNVLEGKIKLQSELAGPMIAKIFSSGTCELTPLKESIAQHEVFLIAMLKHWNTSNKCNDELVPIT